MSRATGLRGALWIAVAGSTLQVGCIHNHYYGTTATVPGCPPIGSTVTTQVGSICDVPSGQVIVSNASTDSRVNAGGAEPTPRASIVSSPGASRVVINQPALGPPSIGQNSGRIRWRKPDPESLPTMKAEGGLDEPIIR